MKSINIQFPKLLMVLFLLMMVCVSDVYAQRLKHDIESLRGLKGVHVVTEFIQPNLKEEGLERDQIQTDIELKLQSAGIKVLTLEEWENESGWPYLYFNVTGLQDNKSGLYAINIRFSLRQIVYLERDSKVVIEAETWYNEYLLLVEVIELVFIRDSIKDGVDKFIKDYLSVNPK